MESISLDPGDDLELTKELEEELLGGNELATAKEHKGEKGGVKEKRKNSETTGHGKKKKREGVTAQQSSEMMDKEKGQGSAAETQEKESTRATAQKNEDKGSEKKDGKEKESKWATAQFANEGFGSPKIKQSTVTIRDSKPEVREYIVCQVQQKAVILVYPCPATENNFPFIISVPDSFEGNFARPLLIGDSVFVEEYEWIEGKELLDQSKWIFAGQIRGQATLKKVESVLYAAHHKQLGIVVEKSFRGNKEVGSISAVAFGMRRAMFVCARQCLTGLELRNVSVSQVVEVHMTKIREGWSIGTSYILPQNSPVRQGTEFQARVGDKVAVLVSAFEKEWPRKTESGLPIIYPFVSAYSDEEREIAERIVAAALIVAAETEEMVRIMTQFQGVVQPIWDGVDPDQNELPHRYWLKFVTTERKHVKRLVDQWAIDTPVIARKDAYSDAFGQGQVLRVSKRMRMEGEKDQFEVNVKITLGSHEDTDKQHHEFRAMLNEEEVLIQPAGATSSYAEQAEIFGTNMPSKIAKEGTARGAIMKALLGYPRGISEQEEEAGFTVNIEPEILDWQPVRRLNEEQKKAVLLLVSPDPFLILQQAPPGTGKTMTLASAIDLIVNFGEKDDVVVASATSNLPVTKMVEETKALGVREDTIAFFSGTARVRYGEQIKELGSELLRQKLTDDFMSDVKSNAWRRDFNKYAKHVETNPMRVREAKVGSAYLQQAMKKVIFATTSMTVRIPQATEKTTHLLIDEATQVPFTSLVQLVCLTPKLRKMLVTGDVRQLGVHLNELPDVLWAGFGLESATTQLVKSPSVPETVLRLCYRSHGVLVNCISHASYELHGEEVLPVEQITEARTALTKSSINLPVADIPLVMIHSEGRISTDETSFSVSNEEHNRIGRELVFILDVNLPLEVKIVVICLYSHERDVLLANLERAKARGRLRRSVEVHTVDSYQAKESDIIIVLTTRTGATNQANKLTSEFFSDGRRATVALSRARDGMFLVGDFRTLSEGSVWQRFVSKALESVPIFTDEYLSLMDSPRTQRINGILANTHGYSPIENLEEPRRKREFRGPRASTAKAQHHGGPPGMPDNRAGPSTSSVSQRLERTASRPMVGPARMRTCYKCQQKGHIARDCRN